MGGESNFACKLAGIVGICAVSQVGFVLVHKWLKFRAISRDPGGSHQVFFVNPIECGPQCRERNCRRSKRLSHGEIFHEISKRIDTAKFSIDLAIYVITCMEVAEALGRARNRGVRVRVIADNSLAHSTGSQIGVMMKYFPVLLFNCADGLMHHKFCLIDAPPLDPPQMDTVFGGSVRSALKCVSKWFQCESARECEENGILITGSLNWTMRGSTSNFENVIITTSSALIREFQSEFENIWTHLSADGL
ncbi:mitochondrial cardiolipin hydrolase [Phlebotomus papatasi]|uniref:mitochondrial cardiolipin hydrolase n=1 Tax=Phlebotomus papatasi TaxID=29031 RepID=UPI0024840F37|nr:mitochondrial cardiolipin hydrolase [Phlebotomus papatasi]